MRTQISKYEQQAIDFAEKHGLTMMAVYLGHYPRLSNYITANYRITLTRKGKVQPFGFDFSTSINDSWKHHDSSFRMKKGLPYNMNLDSFFQAYLQHPNKTDFAGYTIQKAQKAPTLYDVLACLTKYAPGSFEEFCSGYGYDIDSIKAHKTWEAVTTEYAEVHRMFADCLDELAEIQ